MRFKVIRMSEFCAGNCRFELSQEVNLSHLSVVKRGFVSIYNQVEVVRCSLHNLKIACQ